MSDLARRRFQKLTAPLRKTGRREEPETRATDETSANAAFSSSAGAGSVDATVTVLEEVVRRHSRAASTFVGSSPTAAKAARPPAVSTRVVRIPTFTFRDSAGADTGATEQ
jgi:hypothetical protein